MPAAESIPLALVEEGVRVMRICNACRYCEGYCAVFPALERRLDFAEGDLNYLANLCHACGSCYDACQYAPPHEFALNFPRTLAEIRAASYEKYAWPDALGGLFRRNGLTVSLATAACVALWLAAAAVLADPSARFAAHGGGFYAVVPHGVMIWTFAAAALFVLVALFIGFIRFWRDMGESLAAFLNPNALWRAALDVLRLKHLDGGGEGCMEPDQPPSFARRRFHHFAFYGFLLCFAATVTGTLYHYVFGWKAPYPLLSVPVILGTVGGIGLLVGPAGLLWLKLRRQPVLSDPNQDGMDNGFIALLLLASLTGLALLALRDTAAMGVLLLVHLGVVLALFVTMPHGKFVHGLYRSAALVRYFLERGRPAVNGGAE